MSDDLIRIAANELAREVKRRRPRHVNEMATVVDVSNLVSNGTVSVRRRDGTRVTAVAWTQADLTEGTSVFIAPMHDDGHNKRYMVVSANADGKTGRWNDKWEANKRYEKGDIVRYARKTWICTARVRSDEPPPDDPDHWDKHTESPIQNAGKWEINKTYDEGDIVKWNGRQWISLKDDNEGKEPGKSANWWERFAGDGNDQGEWNGATAYEADDIVNYKGRRYLCIQDTFAGIEPEVTESPDWEDYWRLYVGSTSDRGKWEQNRQYQKDDLVRWKGRTWIAKAKSKGEEPSKNSNKWEIFTDKGVDNQGPWEATVAYETDMIVTYDGRSYIAIEDSYNKEPTVHPDWKNYWQVFVDKATNDRGQYEKTADYEKNDTVQYKGQTWLCLKKLDQNNNEANQFPPGERKSKEYWKKYAGGTVNKGEWNDYTYYEEDDLVTYGGTTYRCRQDMYVIHEPGTLGSSVYWEVYAGGSEPVDEDWSSGKKYKQGQIVPYKGSLWKCRQTHTSASSNRPGKDDALWRLYVEKGGEIRTDGNGSTEWQSGVEYYLGDIVTYGGATWRFVSRIPSDSGGFPSLANALWKRMASDGKGKAITTWQAGVAYDKDDVVLWQGGTYKATNALTTAQNNEEPDEVGSTKWTLIAEHPPRFRRNWDNLKDSISASNPIRPGDVVKNNKVQWIALRKMKNNNFPPNEANAALGYWSDLLNDGSDGIVPIGAQGPTGPLGPQGLIGPQGLPGDVALPEGSLLFKGAWSPTVAYPANSMVTYNNGVWFCQNPVPAGSTPGTTNSGWTPFSQAGTDTDGDGTLEIPVVFDLITMPQRIDGAADKAKALGPVVRLPFSELGPNYEFKTSMGARFYYGWRGKVGTRSAFSSARDTTRGGGTPKVKIALSVKTAAAGWFELTTSKNLYTSESEQDNRLIGKSDGTGDTKGLNRLKMAEKIRCMVSTESTSGKMTINYAMLLVYFGSALDDETEQVGE